MTPYNSIQMRRLIMRSESLFQRWEILSVDCTDYGEAALRQIYDELILPSPPMMEQYEKMLELDEPAHTVRETPLTRSIEMMIAMNGWRGFIEGFILFAKNKEATLKLMGLINEQKAWRKVIDGLSVFPKNPQQ